MEVAEGMEAAVEVKVATETTVGVVVARLTMVEVEGKTTRAMGMAMTTTEAGMTDARV